MRLGTSVQLELIEAFAYQVQLLETLSHPGLSTTIVGTASAGHLASNIATAEKGPLPSDLYAEAKKRLPDPAA